MSLESDAKRRLQVIAENDYRPPEDEAAAVFATDILPYLGSTDGELREQYVYGTLHRWIVRGTLSPIEITALMSTLIDADHLFLGIDSPGDNTVFMRAFSALLLVPIVYAHRQDPFLSAPHLGSILTQIIEYMDREQDLRGYISPQMWWAHGIAHAADVLGQLGQCEDVQAEDLMAMLGAIARKAKADSSVFIFEEDERMAAAAIEILKRRELDSERMTGWFSQLVPKARWTGELPQVHHRFLNARNVLRCLSFQAREVDLPSALLDGIEAALAALPKR